MLGFRVLESQTRPHRPGECFYCYAAIKGNHLGDCVLIKKKVKVRCVIEYEIDVPNSWDKEQIEFSRNEGHWCSNNLINEITIESENNGCLCNAVKFDVIDMMEGQEPFVNEE